MFQEELTKEVKMNNKTFEENEVYIIHAPEDWLNLEITFPSGIKLDAKHLIKEKLQDCYLTLKQKDRSIELEMTDGMKELFVMKGLKYFFRDAFKTKTKPKGSNPKFIKRNEQIRKEYYELHSKKGYKSSKVHSLLAEKYNLAVETIKTYVK
jgi:hypothetical protein